MMAHIIFGVKRCSLLKSSVEEAGALDLASVLTGR